MFLDKPCVGTPVVTEDRKFLYIHVNHYIMDKHFQQVVSVHIKVAFVVEKKSLLYQFKVDRGIFVGLNV